MSVWNVIQYKTLKMDTIVLLTQKVKSLKKKSYKTEEKAIPSS